MWMYRLALFASLNGYRIDMKILRPVMRFLGAVTLLCSAPMALCQLSGPPGVKARASEDLPRMTFVHRAVMDQWGAYIMLWSPLVDKIVVEVQVATEGYVGFGFSPSGSMKGADVVIAWVDSSNILHFQDRYAFAYLTPSIDNSQDYQLLGGYQNASHTVIRFSRPWTTCDNQHDFQLSGDTVRVIWAYDDEDPYGMERIQRHGHQGIRSLYLREPRPQNLPANPDVLYWDVLSPKVSLPDNLRTLYWCKLYKIPDLTRKTHVIGYRPAIQSGNEQHVHHMLLYECHLDNAHQYLDKFVEAPGAQCYDRNMPFSWSACNTPIVAWAVGSEGEMYPDHVGVPLGAEHGGATYFMLEIHYDNPNLRKGVTDNSGVRIHYTHKLRQYDAGILTLGHIVSPTHIIPPGQKWQTVAHCTDACTARGIPPGGIKVFQGFLHAHLLASSISIQQIRKGREMPVVFKDMSYDFNYQQARVLEEDMEILPGDSLVVKCGYDSTKRKSPTFGGFSTEDEMCLAFLTYYPRVNLSGCYSKPDMALVFDTFGIENLYNNDMSIFNDQSFSETYISEEDENSDLSNMLTEGNNKPQNIHLGDIYHYVVIKSPQKYYNRTFYDVLYDENTWKDTRLVSALQDRISFGQHEPTCENHGRILIEGLPRKIKYPDFISIQPLKQECSPPSTRDDEIYRPEIQSDSPKTTVKPIIYKERQEDEALSTQAPNISLATVPSRPLEENEIEQDSLKLGGRAGSEKISLTKMAFFGTIFIVILGWC
ncbi:DBH-like monooxygenase protein 1 isoform X1 [Palaemon carinicauda]|uniref:DBH-like monooxygenase protein 1 isoform X1 n=2 Tax=Palaemon carinicauda TaxID=392227 RepID=UPI0035B5BDC6